MSDKDTFVDRRVIPHITVEQLLPLLESLIESYQTLEARIDALKAEVIEAISESQVAIEDKLDDLDFNDDYPGLSD